MAADPLQRGLSSTPPEWKATTRVAFRFLLIYLTLYAAATQILGGLLVVPGFSFPALGQREPMRSVTEWWARVLRVESPLLTTGNSGDTAFYWVQMSWLLLAALVATVVWTELTSRREHRRLHRCLTLFVRFALAAQMFYYGMAKVIPTQFPAPSLVTLLEQVGNLSLSDMLWTFVGASVPYQIVAGAAEVVAGVLLVIPQTVTLGAVIALADLTQVFVLNMAYDFGLKLISAHLILMCLFLLAPKAPALWHTLTANEADLGLAMAAGRRSRVAQALFGLYLLVVFTNLSWNNWSAISGGRPRSVYYGIWDVTELSMNGTTGPPALNAYDYRWRRVVFDTPDVVVIQRTDDSFLHYTSSPSDDGRRMTLSKGASALWRGAWDVEPLDEDRIILRGEMEGYAVEARLQRVSLDTMRLLNSGFRWIRPPDQVERTGNEPSPE